MLLFSFFRQLQTTTNLFLLSLAVSDFLVGFLILMCFQILLIQGCWFLGDLMCALYSVFDYIITSASIGAMVLISVDRYIAICDPLRYPTKVTQKRVSVIIPVLLLKDNLIEPGRYNSCIGECVFVINYIEGIIDVFLSFISPVTVIIVLYMRVFVVAVSQAR
ncbi:hypothetical protein LDENG_00023440, partial [Lucifuga dentata]